MKQSHINSRRMCPQWMAILPHAMRPVTCSHSFHTRVLDQTLTESREAHTIPPNMMFPTVQRVIFPILLLIPDILRCIGQ